MLQFISTVFPLTYCATAQRFCHWPVTAGLRVQLQANSCRISEIATHHVTRHDTLIHNILSTAPQLSISQTALGTLPEDGNVMPEYVGATIHN
jgi:hypothetical protein